MSCKYKNECPSYTGWCEGPKQDFSKCASFLISAYWNMTNKEFDRLLKRFRHLLESDVIREYDEVNPRTGNYKKDIKELDRMFKKFTEVKLTTAPKPEPPKNQYGKVMADSIITGTTPIITIDSKGVRLTYNSIDDVPDDMLMSILKERQIKNQYEYISMSIEEQDKIIFNLLQDRYRWIREDPRTMDEDEVKYRKQIEYLYNLYKNKIK